MRRVRPPARWRPRLRLRLRPRLRPRLDGNTERKSPESTQSCCCSHKGRFHGGRLAKRFPHRAAIPWMWQSNLHVSNGPSESDSVMLLPRQRTVPAQVESLWAETLPKELPVASAVAARKELNASSRQDYWRRRRRRRMRRIEEHDEEDGEEPLDVCFPPTPSFSSPSPWPFGYRKCYNRSRIDM